VFYTERLKLRLLPEDARERQALLSALDTIAEGSLAARLVTLARQFTPSTVS
jgi:hypothetical protein